MNTSYKVVNCNCFDYIKEIESNSIDIILTDPPYLISKESGFKNYSDNATDEIRKKFGNISIDFGDWDKQELDWDLLFNEYYRILKKGGTLIFFFDIWKSSMIKEVAEKNKFKQLRICQWQKSNPVPINSKLNYLSNAIEYFFSFVKGGKPTFNSEYDNGIYKYPICHGNERYDHPTQKPLELMKDLIRKHSNEGDLVLDTFAGTGTTGHAALLLNRKFILIEQNVEYYQIIQDRLNKVNI